MRRPWRRFLFAAVLLAAVGVLLFAGKTLDAGVAGSPHDFSSITAIAPSGTCSACHIPHGAESPLLWPRKLSRYQSELGNVAGGGSNPNYILSFTIQCYDCHDSDSANLDLSELGTSTSLPGFDAFDSGRKPPAVAFGMNYTGSPSTQGYNGAWTPDGPGGSAVGFFETVPQANKGSVDTIQYGVRSDLNWPTDNAVMPGGHYFKSADPNSPNVRKGDKIPCNICHDPHTTENQAFIRNPLAGSTLTGVSASNYMANAPSSGTRSPSDSRKFCIHCHGTSGTTSPKNYSNLGYSVSQTIVRPKTGTDAHADNSSVACTSCHKHNSIEVACNSCHSYPGMDNTNSGKQMSRGHWAHVGQPGEGGTANSMGYDCKVCHFNYDATHPLSGYGPGEAWIAPNYYANVKVQFDPAWNPGNPTYADCNASTLSAPGVGGTGTCAGLYCHGDNPEKNLMWEGSAKQPTWAGTVVCGACHKADSNLRQGNHAVHVDNTGANARGPGGIAVYSPAGNCSDGTATGCHTAYGKTPTTTHARGTTTFRTSPASGGATDNNGTLICNNCHSTQIVGYLDNGASNTTTTGVAFAKGTWKDNTYRLPCLTCHNNIGQAAGSTANARMDGTGAWAPGIEKYWRASGHGYPSGAPVDDPSTTTVSDNVNQVLPLPCGSCHDVNSRHFGNTTATGNAWRLLSSSGYSAAQGLDKFCALQCHGGSEAGTSWNCVKPALPMDHFWIDGNTLECPRDPYKEGTDTHPSSRSVEIGGKTRVPHEMGTYYMPIDPDIRSGGGNNILCVTCHDPHGTGAGDAFHWGRSFAGANETSPLDNIHMLRYEQRLELCTTCHI